MRRLWTQRRLLQRWRTIASQITCISMETWHNSHVGPLKSSRRGLAGWCVLSVLALTAAVPAEASALSDAEDAEAASLNIRITNVRNADGHVLLLIFNDADGFPNKSGKAIDSARIRARNGGVSHVVPNLSPGRYAVTVIHDENDNIKLDTNLFGIPKEGWGTSRNPRPRTRAPRWSESSFTLEAGPRRDISITLLYP